jgi:hypothetical protein
MPQARWKVSMDLKGQLPNVKQQMREVLRLTADAARVEWVKSAKNLLHTTVNQYVEGIGYPTIKGFTAEIKLSGWLPNALEEGISPFDLKIGLLKSKKAKRMKKGGKYIRIPFGLKTPGAQGVSPQVMPAPIYKSAVKLNFGQSVKLPVKYENMGLRTRLSPDLKKWQHYTWKSSPFAGITKVQKYPGMLPSSKTGKLAAYKTFRTVSSKSDPSSWVHPGFRDRKILEVAANQIQHIFPEVMNQVMGVN